MARKKSGGLTDAELRLMEVVWQRGRATVSEVAKAVSQERPLGYSTVLTTLRILESKGYLRHRKEGRAFVYAAAVGREEVREHAVLQLARRFFGGSPERLVLSLIDGNRISATELRRLRGRTGQPEEGRDGNGNDSGGAD
jgi:predicted transcriptional regulator